MYVIVIETLNYPLFLLNDSVCLDLFLTNCNAITVEDVLQATLGRATNSVLSGFAGNVSLLAGSLKRHINNLR